MRIKTTRLHSQICRSHTWPYMAHRPEWILPSGLLDECRKYQDIYEKENESRVLQWVWGRASGEVHFLNSKGKEYWFEATLTQILVLLQFNHCSETQSAKFAAHSRTVSQLFDSTKIELDSLNQVKILFLLCNQCSMSNIHFFELRLSKV